MPSLVRWFLALEAGVFAAAALMHAGVIVGGYEHSKAQTAESVIASVLGIGLLAATIFPASSRGIALGVQGFALLGTAVGLLTIAIGIGPRTVVDVLLHGIMIALLVVGMITVGRHRVLA